MQLNRILAIALACTLLIGLAIFWSKQLGDTTAEPAFGAWHPYRDPGVVLRVDDGQRKVECGFGADHVYARALAGHPTELRSKLYTTALPSGSDTPDEPRSAANANTQPLLHDDVGYRQFEVALIEVEFEDAADGKYQLNKPVVIRTPKTDQKPESLVTLDSLGLKVCWLPTAIALKVIVSASEGLRRPLIAGGSISFEDKRSELSAQSEGFVGNMLLTNLEHTLGRALNVQIDVTVSEQGSRVDLRLKLPE